ncbi:MAG: energy transducer TonB [Terriglobia bacterium]
MFEQTLVDSSPDRAPIVTTTQWIIIVALGVLGFFFYRFGVTLALGRPQSTALLYVQSVVFGFIPFFVTALILSYVYSDCRRLKLNPIPWFILTLILSFLGFLIYLLYTGSKTKDWKRASMIIGYIVDAILIGACVLYPLIYTNALPKAQMLTFLSAPPPPPPPPPPPAAAPPKIVVHHVSLADLMKAPTVIPKRIKLIKDQPQPANTGVVGGVPGGVPGGSTGGVLGGLLGSMTAAPPPPPKAAVPQRIRVGGQVEAAKAIYRPMPQFPPLARMARIQGTVRLEAVISKDGTIQDLKVISGHPLLVQAALQAVRQWRYEPTLLNGVPVEVVTEIDVNFTLSD